MKKQWGKDFAEDSDLRMCLDITGETNPASVIISEIGWI